MKILHISMSDIRGGASRGAYWLHRALIDQDIDSALLVGRKYSDDSTVHQIAGNLAPAEERLRGALDSLPLRRYRKTDDSFWTVGWVPRQVRDAVAAHRPDLIHIHWTGAGLLPIAALRQLPYPIVWTMRDMWAFTGGCHYTAGCERYRLGCGRCPQLRSHDEDDLSRSVWRRKDAEWRDLDLWLVPISTWLGECAHRSPLFEDVPIEVIPNGVDTRRFRPETTEQAKARWNLPQDKGHILFGAINALSDKRKGFEQLAGALRRLTAWCWSTRSELVVFGDTEPDSMPDLGIPTRFVGHIDNDEQLASLYAAGDVMVVPSIQEAFGKTIIEAMACGTPVVAFGSGGPVDVIEHCETGYLAEPFDPTDLARGIAWCLEDPERRRRTGQRARERVESTYDIGAIAGQYTELYRRILSRAP